MNKYALKSDYTILQIENKNINKDSYLFVADSLEECLMYIYDHKISKKYYIQLNYRLCYGSFEGKLRSEAYSYRSELQNIESYRKEIFLPYDSDEYNKYWSDEENVDYKPFISEVWFRNGNSLKLIFERKDETKDFEKVI